MVIKKFYIFLFFLISFLFFPVKINAQEGCDPVASNQTTCEDPFPIACKQQMPNAGNIKRWCCDTQDSCDLTKDATQEQISTTLVSNDVEAYPKIGFPCDDTENPEFHSLRPYQGAICGDANKASFCSNELKFIESFDLANRCRQYRKNVEGQFDCPVSFPVNPHNLYVELTNSMFPILGNTEQVTNSQGGTEQFDDAQKVNEYVSWYLSGVNNKAEYGENTDKRTVDFSGPVQKLLPKLIQEAERIQTISNVNGTDTYFDEASQEDVVDQPLNHNQIVVCEKDNKAVPCPEGKELRLDDWGEGKLSTLNTLLNIVPGVDKWNNRYPPLPWQFDKQIDYQKAYGEWQGKVCVILPLFGLQCLDPKIGDLIDIVPNKWSDLYQYIPLANTTDKGGVQRIVGVQFQESNGTAISGQDYDGDNLKSAPLSFAHTQEVKELSEALNTTYLPQGYESEKQSETTEKLKYDLNSGSGMACSAVNVRTNPGDNLFPGDRAVGDTKEMIIPGITYNIDSVKCVETAPEFGCKGPNNSICKLWPGNLTCNAEVAIVVKTIIRVPNMEEIFSNTTADSGSTFRKIFPKVEEGAPVSCIADIPGVSAVTYNADESKDPNGGDVELSVTNYPKDGGGSGSELTFPHVGSIYEYFLNGIQTALRPKGYGEPLVNGDCKNNLKCGELPELPQAKGSCNLGGTSSRVGDIPQNLKDIVSAASETYKVPPNLILGVLFGEGVFNRSDKNEQYSKYDWTEENVIAWGSCEPLPNCTGPSTSLVSFVTDSNWNKVASKVAGDLKKLDPNKVNPDPCNLVDVIYVIAWDLHDSGDGGMDFQCFGLDLKSTIPSSCSWNDNQIISAIKVFENGYDRACFTKENSCATGGGNAARCGVGGGVNPDRCETITNRYSSQPSHMGCVFDVSKGK